ncbi:kinase-like domain-containing protein [Trichoderma novae-zelandiae]
MHVNVPPETAPVAQLQETIIDNRWRLDGIIGQGGFGSVYIATDILTNQIVAIKLQSLPIPHNPSQIDDLEHESLFYTLLRNDPGIATFHAHGRNTGPPSSSSSSFEYMVCELLGATLQSLFFRCGNKFSLKTTLMLADQLITRLESFHSRQVLHRDVKPDNFAMGFGAEKGKTVYILDFGLVGDYMDDDRTVLAPSYAFCGSYYWAAISAHLDRSQSPKDDLESLAYMLIYFARGSLPWQGYAHADEPTNAMRERITRLKLSTPVDVICQGLPSAFARHLKYVRSLGYKDRPDYGKLRAMYRRLMQRRGYEYDGVFDWDELDDSGVKGDEGPADGNGQVEDDKHPVEKDKEDDLPLRIPSKRKIIFIKKANDESPPPKKQRGKPAEANKQEKEAEAKVEQDNGNKVKVRVKKAKKVKVKVVVKRAKGRKALARE